MQSPPSSPRAALIAAPPLGLVNHYQNSSRTDKQNQQPPRPESRSDSFARAETLLREYRQTNNNHIDSVKVQDKFQKSGQLESGNGDSYSENGYLTNYNLMVTSNGVKDPMDTGLLAVVDQQQARQNSADPLVSLIQSLADISPIHGSSTNKNIQANSITNTSAVITTTTNTTNSSPNQSPKAWQSSTQVCRNALHLFTLP